MGKRIDYLDDPEAPPASSAVPSVNVVVLSDAGEILLIRRTDNGNWALPGGAMDPGESMTDAAVREVEEETGITCEVTGLVGVYTNPRHVILYTSNNEVRQEFSLVYTARALIGTPTPSDESSAVRWVRAEDVGNYQMHPSMQLGIEHFLAKLPAPYLG
ncbi:MAG: NUDIX hydrolase [Micromonosporaceae bacterium]